MAAMEAIATTSAMRTAAFVVSAATLAVGATAAVQEARGHEVLPPAYGTRYAMPAVRSSDPSAGDTPITRHGLDWMRRGIDAKLRQLTGG